MKKKKQLKKKGFTLIELLAVILILGIIALIAIPQVTNVIENANKGSAEVSAKHYVDAVNNKVALNKLSGNDIGNGVKDISEIEVDITGSAPESGYVLIEDGRVKHAELEVNGYTVTCEKSGKCHAAQYAYFYAEEELTSIGQTASTKPGNYNAYLRINKNDMMDKQGCIIKNDLELCISINDFETSKQKIFDYFEFNETTWRKDDSNSSIVYYYKDDDKNTSCNFWNNGDNIWCGNSEKSLTAVKDGSIIVADVANEFECFAYDDGYAECFDRS